MQREAALCLQLDAALPQCVRAEFLVTQVTKWAAYFESSKQLCSEMVVVLGVPRRNMVGETFVIPSISIPLSITEATAAFLFCFTTRVRSPSAELTSRNGVDAAKAVWFTVGAANADAVFERIGDVLHELRCWDQWISDEHYIKLRSELIPASRPCPLRHRL